MSRPLAAAGLSFLFGCLMFSALGMTVSAVVSAVLVLFCLTSLCVYFFGNRNTKLIVTVSGFTALALLYCFITCFIRVKPLDRYIGKTGYIRGTVESINCYSNGQSYVIRSSSVNIGEAYEDSNFLFSYYSRDNLDCEIGDSISGEFTFNSAEGGIFESSWGEDVYLQARCEDTGSISIYPLSGGVNLKRTLSNIRHAFETRLFCCFDTASAKLADAMLLGTRQYIKESDRSNFSLAGASHLLVVSGLHLSLCAGFVMAFLGLFAISPRIKLILSMAFVIAFMFVSGMHSSVVRAGIMFIVCTLAKLSGYEYDSLSALSLSAVVILLYNPFAAASAGFLYSFAATLGIELYTDSIQSTLNKGINFLKNTKLLSILYIILKNIISAFSVSLAASVMTLPISMLIGSSGSLFSAVSSVVISVPASFVIGIAMLFALFPQPLHIIIEPLKIAVSLCTRFILWFVSLFSGTASYGLAYLAPLTALCLIIIILLSVFLLKRTRFAAVILCFIITGSAIFAEHLYFRSDDRAFLIVCSDSGAYSAAVVKNGAADVYATGSGSLNSMKEALSFVHCNEVEVLTLKSTLNPERWRGLSAKKIISYDKKYAEYSALGENILFEMRNGKWDHENTDIFVCFSLTADVSSDFTIVADSDIIGTEIMPTGPCLLGSEEETLIFELSNGALRILRS